jgi:hypothetical protein
MVKKLLELVAVNDACEFRRGENFLDLLFRTVRRLRL